MVFFIVSSSTERSTMPPWIIIVKCGGMPMR